MLSPFEYYLFSSIYTEVIVNQKLFIALCHKRDKQFVDRQKRLFNRFVIGIDVLSCQHLTNSGAVRISVNTTFGSHKDIRTVQIVFSVSKDIRLILHLSNSINDCFVVFLIQLIKN